MVLNSVTLCLWPLRATQSNEMKPKKHPDKWTKLQKDAGQNT